MGFFRWFGNIDRRIAERRKKNILWAVLSIIFWPFFWFCFSCAALVVALVVGYLSDEITLSFSVSAAQVLYAIDVRTGWLLVDIPRFVRDGPWEFMRSMSWAGYLRLFFLVAVPTLIFIVTSIRSLLRPFAVPLSILAAIAIFSLEVLLGSGYVPVDYARIVREYKLKEPTRIYAADGSNIGCFVTEDRKIVTLSEISPYAIAAILASEDHYFYRHEGFDLRGMARALIANRINATKVAGASTIPQQIRKNVFGEAGKNYLRKWEEAITSIYIVHAIPRDELLELYVNMIFLGAPYGVEEGSQKYFRKSAKELTIRESAFLAALIRDPGEYLYGNEKQRTQVLALTDAIVLQMAAYGFITQEEAHEAMRTPMTPYTEYKGACAKEFPYILAHEWKEVGRITRPLTSSGLEVHTTIDPRVMRAAEEAARNGLTVYRKNQAGYLAHHPAVDHTVAVGVLVTDWNGNILAGVGGQSFKESQFDMALSAKTPSGSTMKPFVYGALLEKIYADERIKRRLACTEAELTESECELFLAQPYHLLDDCRVRDGRIAVPSFVSWKGKILRWHEISNYDEKKKPQGEISCERALAQSLNKAAIDALRQLGDPALGGVEFWISAERAMVEFVQRVGFDGEPRYKNKTGITEEDRGHFLPNYTLPLGSIEVSLPQLMRMYHTLLTGEMCDIGVISSVVSSEGETVLGGEKARSCTAVLEPAVVDALRQLLRAPIDAADNDGHKIGTAARWRSFVWDGVRPFATCDLFGKTGTVNDFTAAAFVGCNDRVCVIARMSTRDGWNSLGSRVTGGTYLLPVVAETMYKGGLSDPACAALEAKPIPKVQQTVTKKKEKKKN